MTPVALITGAGSGIGRASAIALNRAGYNIALTGRRKAQLEETAAQARPDSSLVVPADVSDPAAVRAVFAELEKKWGRLDLLFNNAGGGSMPVPLEDIAFEDWQRVIGTNLTGAFLCTQGAFRMMKAQKPQGGRIINNGSISAHVPRPSSAPYTSSKHAMTGLTKATSLDGRPFNIACGQIDIGNAGTEIAQVFTKGVPQADLAIRPEPVIDVDHVVRAVVQMATLPLDVNIQFITIMATKMPYIGRG